MLDAGISSGDEPFEEVAEVSRQLPQVNRGKSQTSRTMFGAHPLDFKGSPHYSLANSGE
jgi:hypothetical protein